MIKFAQPQLDEDTIQAVAGVLRSNWLATGPHVTAFEQALSHSFGGRPTRVVTSATGAIEIALQVCGIGAGDEVITSAQSFFSAMNMIVKVGATPVFVDCDLHTRAIDLAQVEAAITPRTRAIMPTHFPGALGDLDALYALARRHRLRVIEDAALVQGSYWNERPVGGFGDIATFSFHPNKNMTSIEGGAIVVASEDDAALVDLLRFHGIRRLPDDTRDVAVAAGKFNMSDVSAIIGLHQLRQLPAFLAQRAALADRYFQQLPALPGVVAPPRGVARQSWNMFNLLIPYERFGHTRQSFRAALQDRGVGTGMSYEACHQTSVGRGFGYTDGQFPHAERIARETVTLPLHVAMTSADVDLVCAAVAEVLPAQ
ncbi:DegT/DnrJ/EryC1/StrS family aminotransferase [Duganella aceris]|uniref:DegT/DnrJ/EryC1/StrS aminotransferase family protein n=1 Tax=Duganella aceris TaxID=2703883 RepID=A0ABX0FJV0_9BURK|nr:DegT/DnrJ/EryC1/StrS aminotransferase family protein [Duganella aceris]NGZ84796.1 DegT/DnrJ/EryC1/StrS aminotransferase family protein [Duganella aceris]